MKERGILFSAPMVRAILDGRKTQTRRVCKVPSIQPRNADTMRSIIAGCPYGIPGDRLWVRETWAAQHAFDGHRPVMVVVGARFHYRASTEGPSGLMWRPSIFMPRWASRITLEIVKVQLERVQDISEADCQAEGVQISDTGPYWHDSKWLGGFRELWNSVNAKRGFDWLKNPWVWVLEFKRVGEVQR